MDVIQKDMIVVGGGMVGAACALGLGKQGHQVQLIEHAPLPQFQPKIRLTIFAFLRSVLLPLIS